MSRRRRRRQRKPPKRRSFLRVLANLVTVLLLLGAAGAAAALVVLWPRCTGDACPSVAALREYTPPQASRVFDRNGELVAHLAPERRIVLSIEQIPAHVSGAFLAVEDKRFFQHRGIDFQRVLGAMMRNARSWRYDEGFSTISMQLARNLFPDHLSREKTLRRKLQEVVVAREIERAFSKPEILELYLNQIYLGEGLYGVEAAAQGYFGKSTGELLPQEAALLAALPKAPSYYNPRRSPVAAVQRRNLVLSLMAESGVLSGREADRAREAPLGLVAPPESRGEAAYYVAAVRRELRERYGAEAETAGLRVYTLLDPAMQRSAERALREQIEAVEAGRFGRFRGTSCAGRKVENPESCLQGMFVAMDARTGDVRALVGGRDFALSQFDRVMQARRQAGSAFKPIVYATALASGIPITTHLVGPSVNDYEGDYRPADHVSDTLSIDLREGLRASSNRAAVALGERVGAGRVVQTAHEMGLSTPIQEYPSTFLGAAEVIPLELVAAYSVFANNGVLVAPRLIRRIEDSRGNVIFDAPVRTRPVLPAGAAYLTLDLMQDVVDRGTGNGVRTAGLPYSVPAAGKTGTTNDAADVWFIGTTPDLVAGVWLGFDRRQRITGNASGGGLAAPVWGRVVADFYRRHPHPAEWMPPADLVSVEIDVESGLLPTSYCPPEERRMEWFIAGTEPHEYCHLHPETSIDRWFRRTFRGLGDWLRGRVAEERAPPPLNSRRPPAN